MIKFRQIIIESLIDNSDKKDLSLRHENYIIDNVLLEKIRLKNIQIKRLENIIKSKNKEIERLKSLRY